MPFLDAADGTSLFYRAWGEGRPVLFLSGLGMSTQMWDYQVGALGDAGLRCIGLDRRGHGRSDWAARGYDYDTFADDVAALIRKLDLSGLTLIAHSMAGGEVVRYLTRHGPERVARIILVAPTTPKLLRDEDNPDGVPRAAFEELWRQWRQDYPQWVDAALAPFFVPETSRAMMRWGASLLQSPVPIALACSRAMAEADFRAEMLRIEIPSLVIQGDRDRSTPLKLTGRPTAQLLRNSRLVVYEGAPHGLMFTHGDRLHADVVQFIGET